MNISIIIWPGNRSTNGNTYGEELLFRSEANKDHAHIVDGDLATMCVATSGFIKAQENTDQSKRIFVNFTERLILEGAPRALPSSITVVEVLEDTIPATAVTEEIIRLKQDGYFIAIDDFTGGTAQDKLLDLADIIKVDVLNRSFAEIEEIFRSIKTRKALKVAEKVEDRKTYLFLLDLGFDFSKATFSPNQKISAVKRCTPSRLPDCAFCQLSMTPNWILKNLPLSNTLKEGYTNLESDMAWYIQLAVELEQGNNEEFIEHCTRLDLPKSSVAEASLKSGKWTQNIVTSII